MAFSHFACCLGDTLASELGILSKSPPILVTTFKPVPPGTNGGLSFLGTVASLAGGFVMGLTLATTLAIENAVCRQNWVTELVPLLLWGTTAGGLGSLVELQSPIVLFDLMNTGHAARSIRSSEPPYKKLASHPRPNVYYPMKSDQPPRSSRLRSTDWMY